MTPLDNLHLWSGSFEKQPYTRTMNPAAIDLEKDPQAASRAVSIGDHGEENVATPFIEPSVEKKLLRRIDLFTISILGALYLMCFLDRGNM